MNVHLCHTLKMKNNNCCTKATTRFPQTKPWWKWALTCICLCVFTIYCTLVQSESGTVQWRWTRLHETELCCHGNNRIWADLYRENIEEEERGRLCFHSELSFIHTHTHTRMHICVCKYICKCMHLCVYIYICIYINTFHFPFVLWPYDWPTDWRVWCCCCDSRFLNVMAGIKEQQFTEEKPLLPEQRGADSDMVSSPHFLSRFQVSLRQGSQTRFHQGPHR